MREHIGDIINGEYHYPVFREEYIPGHDAYSIDFGGAIGMTDPVPYYTQTIAFRQFERAILEEGI